VYGNSHSFNTYLPRGFSKEKSKYIVLTALSCTQRLRSTRREQREREKKLYSSWDLSLTSPWRGRTSASATLMSQHHIHRPLKAPSEYQGKLCPCEQNIKFFWSTFSTSLMNIAYMQIQLTYFSGDRLHEVSDRIKNNNFSESRLVVPHQHAYVAQELDKFAYPVCAYHRVGRSRLLRTSSGFVQSKHL
jgi:hypothetical protein